MRDIPGYPSDLTAAVPVGQLRIHGHDVPVEDIEVTREVPSSLPSQVHYVNGITAATGTASGVSGEAVDRGVRSPWTVGAPIPGSPVTIDAGYRDATTRVFTGLVDGSTGSVRNGSLTMDLVDGLDQLDKPFTMDALMSQMPPIEDTGEWRNIGLTPTYITDRLLRAAGFYATPPRQAGVVLSAPLMGSTMPELGTVVQSSAAGQANRSTTFLETPWGQGVDSGDVTWAPNLGIESGVLTGTVQISCLLSSTRPNPAGNVLISAQWGPQDSLRLAVTSSRSVSAQVVVGGVATTVATLSAAQMAGADTVVMRVARSGKVTLLASNGSTSSGTRALPSIILTAPLLRVRLTTPNLTAPPVGGVQVNFAETPLHEWERSAFVTPSAYRHGLTAFPAVKDGNVLDLLREQAAAELAGMWLDEDGRFHWSNRDKLIAQSPVTTLTSRVDIADLEWEYSVASLRSLVRVRARLPMVSRGKRYTKLAWQGGGESVDAGEETAFFAESGADESWVMVDESPQQVGVDPFEDLNRGVGTWIGGVSDDGSLTRWAQQVSPGFSVSMARAGVEKYLFSAAAGTPPAGQQVSLRLPNDDTASALWLKWRNEKLPLLRCKARVDWTDGDVTGVHTGPSIAPEMTVDVGPWVQSLEARQAIADDVSAQVNAPSAIIRALPLAVPDPRLQLCDVVWVTDPDHIRTRLKVLITGIKLSIREGDMSQEISCLVISQERLAATLTEHDAVWVADTLTVHDGFWAGSTLTEHDADPLRHP